MENAIEAINLTEYYGDLLALDHINFEVKRRRNKNGDKRC